MRPLILSRAAVAAAVGLVLATGPASAWWRYAEWGKSEEQIVAASRGEAIPCRADVPVCTRTPSGGQPKLFVEAVTMIGLAGSAAFVFDGSGFLIETIVLFPRVTPQEATGLMHGVLGQPADSPSGVAAGRTWQNKERGTVISAVPVGAGVELVYRPSGQKP